MRVDLERIKADVMASAEIGRAPDRGIYRMAFSDADMEGKKWLISRIEEAGLRCISDGAANISGRLEGELEGPTVYIGSHIDTVPCAGALDGTLGVIVGLEALRLLKENGYRPRLPIELISFSDEEGRFGGLFGSQAFCGEITPETLHQTDLDGVSLHDAMQEHGLDPMKALDARRDPRDVHSYIELHIEQGPVLDRNGKHVGIVEDITGLRKWAIEFMGEANHAGTTPMDMRNDAFMGLADFAHEIPRILEENGSALSRATIGKAQIRPGAANSVPGYVDFSLDFRDTNAEVLEELGHAFRRALQAIARRRRLSVNFSEESYVSPVHCDEEITQALEKHARELGYDYEIMPSGAAHDAQIMGGITRIGMVFVPSKDGLSHSPSEWTSWGDVEAGAQLMLESLIDLSNQT